MAGLDPATQQASASEGYEIVVARGDAEFAEFSFLLRVLRDSA